MIGLPRGKAKLNKLEKEDLMKHISELDKKFNPVKEYLDFYINPDEKKLLEQYKEKVTEGLAHIARLKWLFPQA